MKIAPMDGVRRRWPLSVRLPSGVLIEYDQAFCPTPYSGAHGFRGRPFGPSRNCGRESHPLHVFVEHPLLAGLVEVHDQLVAVDGGDVAVAEFLVEDAVADREGGDRAGRLGDQLAFDHERNAAGTTLVATPLPVPPPQGGREPCGAGLRTLVR